MFFWDGLNRFLMRFRAAIAVICLSVVGAFAGKVTMSALIGSNQHVRMVWQKQTRGLPTHYVTATTTIMYYDSREGVVKTLVGGETAKTDPSFTWDGRRVAYFMPNSNQIGVINIDGTNSRTISGTYVRGGRTWRSGTADYILVVQGTNLYRVNIDNTTDKLLLYTGTETSEGVGVSWASMSPDGSKIAGVFPQFPRVGIANVGSSSYTQFDPGGCWPTIARDGTNQVLYTIEPHTHIRIVASNGTTEVLRKELTGIWNDGGSTEYEALRWTNNSDFLTCISYDEPSAVCKGANPKLVKISTLDWSSPNSGVSGVEGNTDAYFYTQTETAKTPLSTLRRSLSSSHRIKQVYDFFGRSLPHGRQSTRPFGNRNYPMTIEVERQEGSALCTRVR